MQSTRKSNEYMNNIFSFALDVDQGKACPAGQKCSVQKQADGTFAAHCDTASNKGKGNKDQKATAGSAKGEHLSS